MGTQRTIVRIPVPRQRGLRLRSPQTVNLSVQTTENDLIQYLLRCLQVTRRKADITNVMFVTKPFSAEFINLGNGDEPTFAGQMVLQELRHEFGYEVVDTEMTTNDGSQITSYIHTLEREVADPPPSLRIWVTPVAEDELPPYEVEDEEATYYDRG